MNFNIFDHGELDAQIIDKVFGYFRTGIDQFVDIKTGEESYLYSYPRYSSNLDAAWVVARMILDKTKDFHLVFHAEYKGSTEPGNLQTPSKAMWACSSRLETVFAPTAPAAICMLALKVINRHD